MTAKPKLEILDDRSLPSVSDLGGGVLHLSTGHEFRVFEDYSGALVWLTGSDGNTTVAPSPFERQHPGGPRVAVLDPQGNRVVPDYWAADPSSRAGVALVAVGGPAAPAPRPAPAAPAFAVPDLTYGDPSDPTNWVIDLDFQEPSSPGWVKSVADEIWRVVGPLGNVALVTRRPAEDPSDYGVVNIGVDLSYVPAEGLTGGLWATRRPGDLVQVDVDGRDIPRGSPDAVPVDPLEVGEIAAHEIGHALGLPHSTELPWNIMTFGHVEPNQTFTAKDLITARENAAEAAAKTEEWKLGSAAATH